MALLIRHRLKTARKGKQEEQPVEVRSVFTLQLFIEDSDAGTEEDPDEEGMSFLQRAYVFNFEVNGQLSMPMDHGLWIMEHG